MERTPLRELREAEGLSLERLAPELGLKSKGHLSRIESGADRAGFRTALRIERWSGGKIRAESLLAPEDAELLDRLPPPGAEESRFAQAAEHPA